VVLGLVRDGVPIAYEIAMSLDARLDVLVVRRLGVPGYEELAMGAIASGGIQVVDRHITKQLGVTNVQLRQVIEREMSALERREEALRGRRPVVDLDGLTAIVTDEGMPTGSTMLAAVTALRIRGPSEIVVAVPVGASDACRSMRTHVDDLHCLVESEMESVTDWYDDSSQTTDDEVRNLLDQANSRRSWTTDRAAAARQHLRR
jgi:predicted phosphoribosyltransferase